MSTDAIFRRYLAAIQDATTLTDADLGAVRLGLRLALTDAQAACEARNAELSDIASLAVAERSALATQVGDLEQQILRLQTMEDRLATWLSHHEPAIAAQFDGDTGAAILHILDRRGVVTINVPTPAQQDNLHRLAERVADTIAAAKPHTNGNGHNGGGATVAPPPTRNGRRYNLTDAELRAATVAGIRTLTNTLGRVPQMADWNQANEELGLPTVAYLLKRLNTKWLDLCAEAAQPATTTNKEAEADHAQATFRS